MQLGVLEVIERELRAPRNGVSEHGRFRATLEPDLAAILQERRNRRLIAEGRPPEPDPPTRSYLFDDAKPMSLADVLLEGGRRRS